MVSICSCQRFSSANGVMESHSPIAQGLLQHHQFIPHHPWVTEILSYPLGAVFYATPVAHMFPVCTWNSTPNLI